MNLKYVRFEYLNMWILIYHSLNSHLINLFYDFQYINWNDLLENDDHTLSTKKCTQHIYFHKFSILKTWIKIISYVILSKRLRLFIQETGPQFMSHNLQNRPVSQIPLCIRHISHNAPFCNRNVHISVTKWCIVGCVWCIVGVVR